MVISAVIFGCRVSGEKIGFIEWMLKLGFNLPPP